MSLLGTAARGAAALGLAAAAGCVNTDAAVFVAPAIATPAAQIDGSSALGIHFQGSFVLTLHLGARASGPSKVSVGTFDLLGADQKTVLVTPLIVASGAPTPIVVQPDSDVTVSFTFNTGAKLLPASVKALLCDPAGITLGGDLQDSLETATTPVHSAVFHPTGC